MKPTHQLRTGTHADVVAWRFMKDAPMPMWVFRAFHDLGGGRNKLTHRNGGVVNLGEWIVVELEKRIAFTLTDEEFQKCFAELPKEELHGSS